MRVQHRLFQRVDPAIFRIPFAPDCMAHECRCVEEEARLLPDACCRHGADLGLDERQAILAHAAEVAAVLHPGLRDPARWFDDSAPERDPEFPSGVVIRTAVQGDASDSGCVFLGHDARGCALHRAALALGLPPPAIKPLVCRLYPLTFGTGALELSDDFPLYSCAHPCPGTPTIYRVMRATLLDAFGAGLVAQLDQLALEAESAASAS